MAPRRFNGWWAFGATAFCAYLPDIIDKPIFWLGLAPAHTGRLWAHGLIFSVLFCLVSRYWIKALWPWALATPFHLVCDRMWEWPHTLLWPFMGLDFDDKLPPGISHLQVMEFLTSRLRIDPWGMAFDLLAEVLGLVLFFLVLRRFFYEAVPTN